MGIFLNFTCLKKGKNVDKVLEEAKGTYYDSNQTVLLLHSNYLHAILI